jgi:hypothetical protein
LLLKSGSMTDGDLGRRQSAGRAMAIAAGALGLCWPALWNRYPLLFPDSISYIQDGRSVWLTLSGRLRGFAGMRSEMYSGGIFLAHWGWSPWPIVVLQALLTAWMVWLVVRVLVTRRVEWVYLAIMAVLCVGTSAGWYASFVMPDVLGALTYLGMFLVVFASDSLRRWERWAVLAVAAWGVTAHATHLLLALGLCVVLAAMAKWCRTSWRGVVQVTAMVLAAVAAQVGLHWALYGKPTLNADRPAYLMGRLFGDGPARDYLKANCGHLDWTVCRWVDRLPTSDDEFLWGEDSIWMVATPAEKIRLRAEEPPLAIATVRAYPGAQLGRSWENFTEQLTGFGLDDFDNNYWMQGMIGRAMPGGAARYGRSLESRNGLPEELFTRVQNWVVGIAAVAMLVLLPWWRQEPQMVGLTVMVVFVEVANAAVTGVLSEVDSRYQSRVVWLVALTGMLIVARVSERRLGAIAGGYSLSSS